jgi:pilus assembly protein Flp/PilA
MFAYTCALAERVRVELLLMTADRKGVTALEYGLLAGLIAVAVIVGAGALGTHLNGMFNTLSTTV